MNKSELILALADDLKTTNKNAERFLDAFIRIVVGKIQNNEHIALAGFGTFDQKTRAEKTIKHPKTLKPVTVKSARIPVFKPSEKFKDLLNQEND